MARKHLSYYLENLSRLEEITVEELKNWQDEFPYVQNLKFLIAKKQQQISENPDKDTMQMASMYSSDRSYLYTKLADHKKEKEISKTDISVKVAAAAVTGTAVVVAKDVSSSNKKKKVKKYAIADRKSSNSPEIKPEAKKTSKKKTPKSPTKKASKKKRPSNIKYDNLKKVEGIGPKIEKLLYASNIRTYKQLAASSENRLIKVLAKGGSKYKSHNPTTWPKQAALAAADKWTQLKKLQDKIVGGKIKTSKTASNKKTSKVKSVAPKPTTKKIKKATIVTKKKSKTPIAKAAATKKAKGKTNSKKSNTSTITAAKTPKPTSAKSKPTRSAKKTSGKKSASTTKKQAAKSKSATRKKATVKSKAKAGAVKKRTSPAKSRTKAKQTKSSAKSSTAAEKKPSKPSTKASSKKKINSLKKSSTKGSTKKSNRVSKQKKAKKKGDGVSSFSQWLMSLRSEDKKQTKTPTKKNKASKKVTNTDSKIKASVKSKDQVVSESLAKLLAKQGHNTKARSMYKKLSLLFPQKSAYFAAQIDKLKSNK